MGNRFLSSREFSGYWRGLEKPLRYLSVMMLTAVFLAACRSEPIPPTPIMPATIPAELAAQAALAKPPTPMITPQSEMVTEPAEGKPVQVTPSGAVWRVGIADNVPVGLAQEVAAFAARHPAQFTWVGEGEADVVVGLGDERPFATWLFTAAAPFATVTDEISLADLQATWQGNGQPFVVDATTAAWLTDKWGMASAAMVVSPDERVATVWQERPSWTIIPFDELQPDLKVLRVDGQFPLAQNFEADRYGLQANVSATSDSSVTSTGSVSELSETAVSEFLATWDGPTSNRDANKLTSVAVTGVTALVRATAYNMEQNGMLWPAEDVGSVLQNADIAHISNEVSFAPDCPYPNPIGGTTFCSGDNTFELLKFLGTDVVELTGNHLNDWGAENLVRSIGMYEAEGMQIFGGGRDGAEAAQPAIFEHNGNKIAFVGCNSFGPAYAWAGEASAGARPCDGSMAAQISQLAADGYQVIATLQGTEYYQYAATPDQQTQFQALAEAGATAVSGSQGHHLQAFEFHNGVFIHYGPGNLFFDQMDQLGTRQTFVDTYHFYNGRLLSVDLWTGLIESYAKPRLMTPKEREDALMTVFRASGW